MDTYPLTARILRPLFVVVFLLLARQYTVAQTVKPAIRKSTSPQVATIPQPSPIASFEGKLVSVFDPEHPDKGDYVPCQFTVEQLLLLRPKPEISVISSYDEEQIKSAVLTAALSQSNTGVFSKGQETAFATALAQAALEGLTMSQALTVVIDILNRATAPSPAGRAAADAATRGPKAMSEWVGQHIPDNPNVTTYFRSQITAARPLDILSQVNSAATTLTQPKSSNPGPATAAKPAENTGKPLTGQPNEHTSGKPEEGSNPPGPPVMTEADKVGLASVQEAATEASQALSEGSTSAKNSIVDSARTSIAAFQRPNDVGCAMSILSWNSVRYAFGQTLAGEYIAIQLVVRNINSQQEFLVHDAEFSVDSDLLGAHGRYFSGLDKLTVRQFMLSSRDYGRRNFLVNMSQGIGTILSATTPVYGGGLANASSVYSAGFLNALTGVWKDHNTEQLNMLNDVGFSASKTDRTVVPKSGTAMFIIFVPVKQFQTGWWTQDCANVIVTSKESPRAPPVGVCSNEEAVTASPKCIEPQDEYKKLAKYPSARTGIDLESARAICQQYYAGGGAGATSNTTASDTAATPPTNSLVSQGPTTIHYIKSPMSVPYRKWSDSANAIFRELSFAIVAGTHLQEEQDTTPSITKIDCAVDGQGNVDFSKASNGVITCDVAGQNLDKAAKLKLRNSQDQSDTKTADGSMTTSGDPKTAKASFSLDQIGVLNQKAYKVFTVTKDGAENDGKQILHFSLEPTLSAAPTGKDIPLALDKLTAKGATSVSIPLNGYHLDKLAGVHLGSSAKEVSAGDSLSIDENVKPKSASEASFDFTPADAAKVPPGDYTAKQFEMYIFLVSKDNPDKKAPTSLKLNGSGNLKGEAAVPGAPPASSQLTLSLPTSSVSGKPTVIKVTIKDASGKVDSNFTGLIHVASSDKLAVLPSSDYFFKVADKGITTLSVTFKTKGKQTITVTSGAMTARASTTVK